MSKFIEKVAKQTSARKGNLLTVDHINHRDGSAICLLTFVNKYGKEKTVSRKVYLNPETYPDALKMEGKVKVL